VSVARSIEVSREAGTKIGCSPPPAGRHYVNAIRRAFRLLGSSATPGTKFGTCCFPRPRPAPSTKWSKLRWGQSHTAEHWGRALAGVAFDIHLCDSRACNRRPCVSVRYRDGCEATPVKPKTCFAYFVSSHRKGAGDLLPGAWRRIKRRRLCCHLK